jgi:hypothetical protein
MVTWPFACGHTLNTASHRQLCNPLNSVAPRTGFEPVHGELLICQQFCEFSVSCYHAEMRDLAILFIHLITTLVRLASPGGVRSVVAESLLVKHQLLILNRSRHRAPNLRLSDRMVAGCCALFQRPSG